jgi:hypothetical protein
MRASAERLVFSPIIAHIEAADANTKQWVRRDFTYICDVGQEVAIEPMPRRPIKHIA